jgi:hypothetical protein
MAASAPQGLCPVPVGIKLICVAVRTTAVLGVDDATAGSERAVTESAANKILIIVTGQSPGAGSAYRKITKVSID